MLKKGEKRYIWVPEHLKMRFLQVVEDLDIHSNDRDSSDNFEESGDKGIFLLITGNWHSHPKYDDPKFYDGYDKEFPRIDIYDIIRDDSYIDKDEIDKFKKTLEKYA